MKKMKLRNKLAAITAAAMLAFTGVGFAAWTFTNTVSNTVSPVTETVCAIELNNNLKMYNAADGTEITELHLILDAPAATAYHLGGNGVYWSTEASNDISKKVTSVYLKGTVHYDEKDIEDLDSVTVSFTKGAELVDTTYIDFGSLATVADVEVDAANNEEYQTANFALPTVAYTSAVDAFNKIADLADLETGLSGLAISYSAKITDQTLA
jgi:hypothetical protein